MRGLFVRLSLCANAAVLAAACGSTPPPQTIETEKPKPKVEEVQGIPKPAVEAFVVGVQALEEQPPAYTKAAEAFEKATQLHAGYVVAWLNLAYSYERLGRHQDSAAAYRKLIEKNVTDRGVTLALGRALLLSGQPEQAIVEFESVLRKHPEDLQARNNLAAAYLAKNDLDTSLRYVKEVLAVQPKNVPAIINLGLLYLRQDKLPLALLMFNKALGYEENNARARNNLGLAFYKQENFPAAVAEFEKALAIDPTMDEARLNVASVFLDYLDYAAALEQFRKVRERFPKHYQAMVGEANALYGTGDYEAAAKLYDESLAMKADNTEVLLRIGKIHEEQLNQPKKALEYYVRFRDIAKPPAEHPINQTIMFLQQADDMKMQEVEGTPTPEGEGAPAEGENAPDGEAKPEGEG